MRTQLTGLTLAVATLFACDRGPAEPTCDLTIDNLAGKSFVMSEAQPNGPDKLNPLARLTFVEDGGLKAKYTAMSLGDIYTYDCSRLEVEGKDPELKCEEPPRLQDWCEAMFARDIYCTKKKLRKLGAEGTDEELDAIVAKTRAAMKEVEDLKDEAVMQRWKAMRASLGNKLQGQLFAKVDSRCRLKIDDMYWTLKPDGSKIEDSNPVGTNPFVRSDEPWMFEHCDNQSDLYDLDKDAFPAEPLTERPENAIGKPIYYFHAGQTAAAPEEGCTYSYDTYAGWRPVAENQTPQVQDGRLLWRAEYTFGDDRVFEYGNKKLGIFHMARYKTCAGKRERIDVACRTTVF